MLWTSRTESVNEQAVHLGPATSTNLARVHLNSESYMAQNLGWHFVSTGGGDADGLNNSMIEHFLGDFNYYLAREILQNSLDARSRKSTGPVKVSFNLEYFQKKDFPGYNGLISCIERAEKFWEKNKQTIQFLKNAKACLRKDRIPFLRISDYNTTGLNGEDDDMASGWFDNLSLISATFN